GDAIIWIQIKRERKKRKNKSFLNKRHEGTPSLHRTIQASISTWFVVFTSNSRADNADHEKRKTRGRTIGNNVPNARNFRLYLGCIQSGAGRVNHFPVPIVFGNSDFAGKMSTKKS